MWSFLYYHFLFVSYILAINYSPFLLKVLDRQQEKRYYFDPMNGRVHNILSSSSPPKSKLMELIDNVRWLILSFSSSVMYEHSGNAVTFPSWFNVDLQSVYHLVVDCHLSNAAVLLPTSKLDGTASLGRVLSHYISRRLMVITVAWSFASWVAHHLSALVFAVNMVLDSSF